MKENRITIIINKPIEEVFEFTTHPKNTHLWIPSITQEIAEVYPPSIGTIYKNKGEGTQWDIYKVIDFKQNEVFTLSDLEDNYHAQYSYTKINNQQTQMEYFEWVKNGTLSNPFHPSIIDTLKEVMES